MARRGSREISIQFTGDADQGVRALREIATEAARTDARFRDAGDDIVRSLDEIERKSRRSSEETVQSTRNIGDAFQQLSSQRLGDLAGGGALGGLTEQLGGLDDVLGSIGTKGTVAAAGIAAVAASAAKLGTASLDAFTTVGSQLAELQALTGASAAEVGGFRQAIVEVGGDFDEVRDSLLDLSHEIADAPEKFDKWGVAIARNRDGTVDLIGTYLNMVEVLASLEDASQQRLLTSELMGEDVQRQTRVVLEQGAALRQLAEDNAGVWSQEDIDRQKEMRLAQAALRAEFEKALATIGSELAPAVTDLAEAAEDLGPAFQLGAKAVGAFAQATGGAVGPVLALHDALGDLKGALNIGGVAAEFDALVRQRTAYQGHIDELNAYGQTTDGVADRLERLREVSTSWADTARQDSTAVAGARARHAAASETLASAEASAAQSIANANRSAAKSIASAQKSLASARASAAKSIQSAQERLADAEQAAAKTISDAHERIADARESAAESIAQAEERIAEAREAQQETVQDLAKAEREAQELIADATEDAAQRVLDAQRRLDDAREARDRRLRDNARKLADAEQAAQDRIVASLSEDDPIRAQRMREEAYEQLRRTREDVADAEKDAAEAVRDAEQGLRDATVEAEERRADAAERAAEMVEAARERIADANERLEDSERAYAKTVEDANERVADAEEALAEATRNANARIADASRSLRDARVNASNQIRQAEINLRNTTIEAERARAQAAHSAAQSVLQARQAEIEAARQLELANLRAENTARAAAGAMQRWLMAVHEAQTRGPLYRMGQVPQGLTAGRAIPPRAHGGPVTAGQPVVVGDAGVPELFIPNQSGRISPGVGGPAVTYVINVGDIYGDSRAFAEYIDKLQRQGLLAGVSAR